MIWTGDELAVRIEPCAAASGTPLVEVVNVALKPKLPTDIRARLLMNRTRNAGVPGVPPVLVVGPSTWKLSIRLPAPLGGGLVKPGMVRKCAASVAAVEPAGKSVVAGSPE